MLASDLDKLVAQIDGPELFHGIILHGSCAKGTDDAASDIDLLCIKRTGRPEKRHAQYMGRDVDLYLSSPRPIKRAFTKAQSNNNNVILNAFVHGRIVVDRTGVVARLLNEASVLWKQGPPPIPRGRQEQRISLLVQELHRLKRVASREVLSPISVEATRIIADTVFRNAIALYCRINRRWASGLLETLAWFQKDDPAFYRLCEEYLMSRSLAERAARLDLVLGAVGGPL